ncbi:MAG: MarR family transcriptional regulator [Campylobacterota bacterium]|nr:MarR family transcriptional regulator [Campylobacterota bacterium]
MKKIRLDNYYKNNFKDDREIFALGLPLTLIRKYMFSRHADLLQVKYDLNSSEFDVLASLLYNGKIMSPTALYEATIFSSGGMTKILKKLKDKELITRVSSKEDKRSMLVKIEPKGEMLVEACIKDIIDIDNDIFSVLDKNDKESLKLILKKLVYSLLED